MLDNFGRQIIANLVQFQGSAIGSISAETKVDLLGGKKNPMKDRVTKVAEGGSVILFTNQKQNGYSNMVHRRLAQEGKDPQNFKLSPRKWGQRLPGTPFVEHKGEYYLECIFLRKPKKVYYLLDGQPIAKKDIQGLKPEPNDESSQGGLNNKVIVRSYKLKSITEIKMGELSVKR